MLNMNTVTPTATAAEIKDLAEAVNSLLTSVKQVYDDDLWKTVLNLLKLINMKCSTLVIESVGIKPLADNP